MKTIDNTEFGKFLSELRKENNLTQKQLAEQLFISDKAVSKWERGLSLPDISLLIPLSKILDVTTTELLSAKRIETDSKLTVAEVDSLISASIILSHEEVLLQRKDKVNRITIFSLSMIAVTIELIVYITQGYSLINMDDNFVLVELLMFGFSLYFTFFIKDNLPTYYDENKINYYTDGIFRINVPGLSFNNSNWRHIVKSVHISMLGSFILLPIVYLSVLYINPLLWEDIGFLISATPLVFMFLVIYIVGKKYE